MDVALACTATGQPSLANASKLPLWLTDNQERDIMKAWRSYCRRHEGGSGRPDVRVRNRCLTLSDIKHLPYYLFPEPKSTLPSTRFTRSTSTDARSKDGSFNNDSASARSDFRTDSGMKLDPSFGKQRVDTHFRAAASTASLAYTAATETMLSASSIRW